MRGKEYKTMSELVYVKARNDAQKLREQCKNVEDLTLFLNITVLESSESRVSVLVKHKGKNPQVVLKAGLNGKEKKVILAHMAGHVVERNNSSFSEEYSFTEGEAYTVHEFYADEFSYEFLMPTSLVVRLYKAGSSPSQIAEDVEVPVKSLNAWLDRLKRSEDI